MKLYKVECENDIGLNISGNIGCYSSMETVDTILNNAENNGYFDGCSIQEWIDDGLLIIKEIEG